MTYDPYKHECKDPEECWEYWLSLWDNSGDTTDLYEDREKLAKNELFDYHMLLSGLGALYDEVTGGRASKENTNKRVIVELVEERIQYHYDEGYDEGYQHGRQDAISDNA